MRITAANRLLIHLAAFGSLLCVAAYVASKFRNGQELATALTRYAQAIAVSIMLFMSLSTASLMACGKTSPRQLTVRAATSFRAFGSDMATMMHLDQNEAASSPKENDQADADEPFSA